MPADPNRVILTGENPFIRLSQTDGGPNTTNASFWRIITCPGGPGHVLFALSHGYRAFLRKVFFSASVISRAVSTNASWPSGITTTIR